jgi:hypothetical protein
MRIFPQCSEGFRRLSIVTGIAACLVGAFFIFDYALDNAQAAYDSCASIIKYPKEHSECLKGASDQTSYQYENAVFALLVLMPIIYYIIVFLMRTVGWVLLGFKRNGI